MSTKSKITSIEKILHLDAGTPEHARDRESKARYSNENPRYEAYEMGPPVPCRYPSVGEGVRMDDQGNELDPNEHVRLHLRLIAERSWYWAPYKKRDQSISYRRQDKKTTLSPGDKLKGLPPTGAAIHALAINYRPDHAHALSMLENEGIATRDLQKEVAIALGKRFETLTGYELISANIHAGDGNLHFHIGYADVDADNQLLHNNRTRGRKGIKRLTDRNLALCRIQKAGITFETDSTKTALNALSKGGKEGKLLIDWELSSLLDRYLESFLKKRIPQHKDQVEACFQEANSVWSKRLEKKFRESKEGIRKAYEAEVIKGQQTENDLEKVLDEVDDYYDEVKRLKQENARLHAAVEAARAPVKAVPVSESRAVASKTPPSRKEGVPPVRDSSPRHVRNYKDPKRFKPVDPGKKAKPARPDHQQPDR